MYHLKQETMDKEKQIQVKHIKNSVVVICGGGLCDGALSKAIKDFDLADKTPVQCHDFLRALKSLISK